MPLFKAIIVKDVTDNRLYLIHAVEIQFFAKNSEYAELMIAVYVSYDLPGMVVDSVYEMGYTGSDPLIAESDKKES